MKILAGLLSAFFCATVLFSINPQASSQGVNDFVIHKLSGLYDLSNDTPGGSLKTTETIDLTFSGYNHGILRAIPIDYNGWNTRIKIIDIEKDGRDEPYTTYNENGNLVLKIGDADKTITGRHSYKIEFQQKRIVNFEGPSPEFYWDVNGDQWSQVFEKVEATIKAPEGTLKDEKALCFTGEFGSRDSGCKIILEGGTVKATTTRPLQPRQTLTVAIPLSAGTFTQPSLRERVVDNIHNLAGIVLGLTLALFALVLWWKKGRDYPGRGVSIAEYEPPKGLTPGEFGLLADFNVDSRDITATIIDMAIRGYIMIHEDEKQFLFKKTKIFTLELTNTDFSKLKAHESEILGAIFPSKTGGEKIEITKIDRRKFAAAANKVRDELNKELTDKYGYFEKNAKKLGGVMIVFGFIVGFISFFLAGWPGAMAGGLIAAAAFIIFGAVMPRRSHAGVDAYEKIQGLKLYMITAEKDRLKMMQSVERPYAEPKKTVDLYEKLLPFAVPLVWKKAGRNNSRPYLQGHLDGILAIIIQPLTQLFSPQVLALLALLLIAVSALQVRAPVAQEAAAEAAEAAAGKDSCGMIV